MISKDAFKKLVLAGAAAVKGYIATEKINQTFADKCDFSRPLFLIASCIDEIVGTDSADSHTVKLRYIDSVSLAAFDNEESEHYADLVYQFLFDPASVVLELAALEETLPKEEFFYVRNEMRMYQKLI